MTLLSPDFVNDGAGEACALQEILDETWTVLATNNLGELEKTIEQLKSICDDKRLQNFSTDDLLAARQTCRRLRTLLGRRSRDLFVTSQLISGDRRETCQR